VSALHPFFEQVKYLKRAGLGCLAAALNRGMIRLNRSIKRYPVGSVILYTVLMLSAIFILREHNAPKISTPTPKFYD
jgi:hypothetical protein